MDRPVILLKHLDDDEVLLAIEYPPGLEPGPVRVERYRLAEELAFPRQTERGVWVRLPARAGKGC